MNRLFDYFYIFVTIGLTVYGQLILKWRIIQLGQFPSELSNQFKFLLALFLDPLILSGFFAAFLASLAWMVAMTKFDLSHAYPFMSLNFVVVLFLSAYLLSEYVSLQKVIGVGLIVLGTLVAARG